MTAAGRFWPWGPFGLGVIWHPQALGSRAMKLVEEYVRRSEECRKLAQRAGIPAHRDAIQKISDMWRKMAEQRQRHLEEMQGREGRDRSD
jgi:hypothetical protein